MPPFKRNSTAAATLLGLALLAACSAMVDVPTVPASGVTLAVQFPADVAFGKVPQRTTEMIGLALTNNDAAPVTLQKPNACQTRIWTAVDSTGHVVDGRNICPMIFMPVTLTLPPHASFTGGESVSLDGTKFKDGARYTLRYVFWGIESETHFTAHTGRG